MFDLNAKLKRARKETIGLSVLTILIGMLFIHITTENEVEIEVSQSYNVQTVDYSNNLWRTPLSDKNTLETFETANVLSAEIVQTEDQLEESDKQELTSSPVKPERAYGNELTDEQYEVLLMVAQQESGGQDYGATLAVMSVITNRVDSDMYQDSVWEVITAFGQFESYGAGHYLRHEGQVTEITKKAVEDSLNGEKSLSMLNFWSDWYYVDSGRYDEEAVNIGENIFFNM